MMAGAIRSNAAASSEQGFVVVAVLWENGQHGNFAAPVARDVIKAYFDKKQRVQGIRVAKAPAQELLPSPQQAEPAVIE